MNNVIVPIDFNDVSVHSAKYASQMLQGHQNVNMILYNHYEKESEAADAQRKLDGLKAELTAGNDLNVEVVAYKGDDFVEDLSRVVRHRKADLCIMGINERSMLVQVFRTSRAVRMAETGICPVLIVPEDATYHTIENVMLASKFKETKNHTPSGPIKDFLSISNPNLHVVNVDPEHFIALTEAYEKEKQDLKTMFSEYNPEFYFLRLYDVDEALNLFAAEKDIDLIITIMKHQNFVDKVLIRTDRSAKLSYQSKIPVLIVHE